MAEVVKPALELGTQDPTHSDPHHHQDCQGGGQETKSWEENTAILRPYTVSHPYPQGGNTALPLTSYQRTSLSSGHAQPPSQVILSTTHQV